MKLEEFRGMLIPVDYVLYAEYIKHTKPGYGSEIKNMTRVHVVIPGTHGMIKCIDIKGKHLQEFKEWFNKFHKETYDFSDIMSTININPTPVIIQDGSSKTETWYPTKTICHDGIEHPV